MNNMMFKKVFYVLGPLLVLFLGYYGALAISRLGETKVSVVVLPGDSTLRINNQNYQPGEHYLKPGLYTFSASREGFKDDSQDIMVSSQPVQVDLLPEPDSQAAWDLIDSDPELQAAREAIGGKRASNRGLAMEQANPIIEVLPFSDIDGPFTIDYGPSETVKNGAVIIIDNSSSEGRENAIKWIRQQGFDPTKLEIRFKDFTNPALPVTGVSNEQ